MTNDELINKINGCLRYEELLSLDIEVGYFTGEKDKLMRNPMMEEFLIKRINEGIKWNIRIFNSISHMENALTNWNPDIIITHWHGESFKNEEKPNEIISAYKKAKKDNKLLFPFLVGQFSGADSRFGHNGKELKLLELYDMLFEKQIEIEIVPWNIAIGLKNFINYFNNKKDKFIPFDPFFRGYLSCIPFSFINREYDIWDDKSRGKMWDLKKRIHEKRIKWLKNYLCL